MAGTPLAVTLVYKLTLAELFFDQALPSAGLSGTVVVAQALAEQGALPRSAVFRWCGGQHNIILHRIRDRLGRSDHDFVLFGARKFCACLAFCSLHIPQCGASRGNTGVFGQGCSWGPSTLAVPPSRYPERGGRHERRGSPAGPQCPSSIDCFMLPVGHFSTGCGDPLAAHSVVGSDGPSESCIRQLHDRE